MDIPGEPAPWLHRHPSKQRLPSYYGPVRQRAPRRYSVPSGFCRRHAPSRDPDRPAPGAPYRRSPSHVPCKSRRPGSRRLYAGHHPARNAGTRQAHPEGHTRTLGFDAICKSFDASTAHAQPETGRALLERLPGPHLTRSRRAFSLNAHHDSLQLTQLQGGLTPTPAGPTPEGQRSSISRTAPPMSGSSTRPLLQRS
jgi:hypothetical protein